MITSTEIIPLVYTTDLTESGIAYACRTLNYTYNRIGGTPYSRLRRIVGNVAVELAFRRYLSEQNIPFEVKNILAFTEPERYDVSLGGHRCNIKSYLITRRPQISDIRHNKAVLLRAPALIPSDQFASESHSDQDLYLFAFISGLVAASHEDIQKAVDANQPTFLMHAFPKEWTHPNTWQPLGRLVLKSESKHAIAVEIGGQNANRELVTVKVELPSMQRVEIDELFHSLAYLHVDRVPEGRLAIFSPVRRETYVIPSAEWGNIWIYGMDIWLTGYIAHEEFRRKASFVSEGSHVFQYKETRTKNLAVPNSDLHSLGDLFGRVKEWEKGHNANES